MMPSIYFAGPDVFSPGYPELKTKIQALCGSCGVQPLLPGDLELDTSEDIFQHNLALIEQADGVIANLNPFRGAIEPDSGTVFECAYAFSKGKWVIGYLQDRRDQLTKLRELPFGPSENNAIYPDGTWVEDFQLPLNLMLAHSLTAIAGSLQEAMELAFAKIQP